MKLGNQFKIKEINTQLHQACICCSTLRNTFLQDSDPRPHYHLICYFIMYLHSIVPSGQKLTVTKIKKQLRKMSQDTISHTMRYIQWECNFSSFSYGAELEEAGIMNKTIFFAIQDKAVCAYFSPLGGKATTLFALQRTAIHNKVYFCRAMFWAIYISS